MIDKSAIILVGFGDLSLLENDYQKTFLSFSVLSAKILSEINLSEFDNAYIQPVYLLSGYEYDRLCHDAQGLPLKAFVANPLLSDEEAFYKTARILGDKYLRENVLFIGHGTSHPACKEAYFQMQQILQKVGFTKSEVGVLEGEPNVYDAIKRLKSKEVNRVTLVPFMISKGKHTKCDIFGDKPESVLSILKSEGIVVEESRKSLLEYPQIRQMFINNTKAILNIHKRFL